MKRVCLVFFILVFFLSSDAQAAQKNTPTVLLETNFGDIVIELFPEDAPITVANFLAYVNSDFYDGLIFHRVMPGFMIQAGGFDQDLNKMSTADPIVNEFVRSNVRRTVAMAKIGGDPDSATSQFFINLVDNSDNLDTNNGGFTVFGEVISDMNVVDAIALTPTHLEGDMNNVPVDDVIIYSATASAGILGDIEGNFSVDSNDFALIANSWLLGQMQQEFSADVSGSEFSDLSGDIYVWQDANDGHDDIRGYNLSDGNQIAICTAADLQQEPSIDGNVVVWRDGRVGSGYEDIYGYDLSTGTEFAVIDAVFHERHPAVSGTMVVWHDDRDYHTNNGQGQLRHNIYGADISDTNNPVYFDINTAARGQMNSAIDGNIVVWEDYRNDEYDIYGADISDTNDPNEIIICIAAGKQVNSAVSGNIVIWEDYRYGNMAIFGYDLSAETEFSIAFGQVANSDVSGDIVVWQDKRHGQWDIYGYDTSAEVEFPVCIADGNQVNPVISGNRVAWRDLDDVSNMLHWRQLCNEYLTGDINGDCTVDFGDVAIMISNWLEYSLYPLP